MGVLIQTDMALKTDILPRKFVVIQFVDGRIEVNQTAANWFEIGTAVMREIIDCIVLVRFCFSSVFYAKFVWYFDSEDFFYI